MLQTAVAVLAGAVSARQAGGDEPVERHVLFGGIEHELAVHFGWDAEDEPGVGAIGEGFGHGLAVGLQVVGHFFGEPLDAAEGRGTRVGQPGRGGQLGNSANEGPGQ